MERLTLILLGILISAIPATAADQIWMIMGKKLLFVEWKKEQYLSNCKKQQQEFSCEAARALRTVSPALIKNTNPRMNTTVLYCKALKGKIRIGTDEKQNEESLCEFSDSSLTSNHSLYTAAELNSILVARPE